MKRQGHPPPTGEWEEVRRRKQASRTYEGDDLTHFYVAGFSNGIRKDELHKSFTRFGKVVDVYLGGRKNYQQMNFAFVRFSDVTDAKALEDSLQGIKCRDMLLQVNISKHQRKKTKLPPPTQNRRTSRHAAPQPISPQTYGERDTRTFAQVITGNRNNQPNTPEIPIELNSNTQMSLWLSKSVLIGEPHSLDHISNLPAWILAIEGTKYLGGLNIAIRFGCSVDAKEYMEDRSRWNEWFKWLVRGDQHDIKYERTAWLKIMGVPLKPVPFDKVEEDSEDESDDDEGVSDTWMHEEDNEEEEGEFRPDNQPEVNKSAPAFTDFNINPEPPVMEENNGEEAEEPLVPNSVDASTGANTNIDDPRVEKGVAVDVPQNTCADLGNKMGEFISSDTSQEQVHIKTKNDIPRFGDFGSAKHLIPFGCFGPFLNNYPPVFTSPIAQNGTTQKSNSYLDSNSGGPKVKKRKKDKHGARSPSITFFTDSSVHINQCNQSSTLYIILT
ncbi:unnamed protein product [Lactuca virosa]|uniref:RRM domain-containing protein n=1 Tax=Lactuca virosa TaxID=75947 RepID=A0AAU9PTH2_9ASTR|nr:unnamed protein product [Lactuca virosa]